MAKDPPSVDDSTPADEKSSTASPETRRDKCDFGELLTTLREIRQAVTPAPKEKPKDFWDKFGSMSTFVSTVLIAGIGLYFTHSYNSAEAKRRQEQEQRANQVNEVEALAKFMPYLTGTDEPAKKTAIMAISTLVGVKTAVQVAELHPSVGTAEAVNVIAQSSTVTKEERKTASSAAERIYDKLPSVEILHATNRTLTNGEAPKYGSALGPLSFGLAMISVPPAHKMGVIERPSILKLEWGNDPERHITTRSLTVLGEPQFLANVRAKLAAAKEKQQLSLYVHGFDMTLEDASLRCAQISYDLALESPLVVFSWPSRGEITGYLADEELASASASDFKKFITILKTYGQTTIPNLVADGLGCRMVVDALSRMAMESTAGPTKLIDELVLLGPDISQDRFLDAWAANLGSVVNRVTIYRSDSRSAWGVAVHGSPRLGATSAAIVSKPGIDTIDITGTNSNSFSVKGWLADLRQLLTGHTPTNQRSLRAMEKQGAKYWALP